MHLFYKLYINQLLFVLLLIFSISTAQAEPIEIRFSHVVANDTPKGKMATRFKNLVKQRIGDDKVIIKIYPNAALFSDNEVVDEMIKGNVELAAPAMSKIKKFSPRYQVLDLPFLFVTPEAASNFLQGEYGNRMLRLVQPHGLLGLGYLNNGMKQLSADEAIKLPTDLSTKRFRIMNSDVLEAQFNQINSVPMRKPFGQVFKLLESNEIDGQENTWSNIYSKKFYEHQPHIIESNHGYLGYLIMTNAKFWNSLPEEYKPILEKSLKESIDYGNKTALEKNTQDKNKILATGKSAIHILTLAERKQWVEAMRPVWKKFEDEIGTELILAAASSR